MKKVNLIFILLIGFSCISYAQNKSIGSQVWMTNNLDVSTFRNGDSIPQAKTDEEWQRAGKDGKPAWCYFDNDPANGKKYGKLYNWYAVNDSRGLAPKGWHVPNWDEWMLLEDYLGNVTVAGKKMKSTIGWSSFTTDGSKTCTNCISWSAEYRRKVPCHTCKDTRSVSALKSTKSGNGSNSSGFSGLPGGARDYNGAFSFVGEQGIWWTTDESILNSTYGAKSLILKHDSDFLLPMEQYKAEGFSVRCIKD